MFLQFSSFFPRVVLYLKGTFGKFVNLVKPEVVAMKVSAVRDHWGRRLLKCQTCDAYMADFPLWEMWYTSPIIFFWGGGG
jgi:hypothetical protein